MSVVSVNSSCGGVGGTDGYGDRCPLCSDGGGDLAGAGVSRKDASKRFQRCKGYLNVHLFVSLLVSNTFRICIKSSSLPS